MSGPLVSSALRCLLNGRFARLFAEHRGHAPAWLLGVAPLMALVCCKTPPADNRTDSGSTSAVVVSETLRAELSRSPNRITAAERSSRDVAQRRAAARALARIASDASRDVLQRALTDEDPEVVSWAAFGLGRICNDNVADPTIKAVIVRAATLLLDSERADPRSGLDPWYALAQALGRCATAASEGVLRSWIQVGPNHARVAALGLDSVARTRGALQDATIVALLGAAEKERGLAAAFLPISRLSKIDGLVAARILALAPQILDTAGEERRFLLRALPLVGPDALPILERVALDDSRYQPLERVEALRSIGKLGSDGQRALSRLVHRIVPNDSLVSEAALLGPRWQLTSELFSQLKQASSSSHTKLSELARVEAPEQRSPAILRRMSFLRCHAAALVSSNDPSSNLIQHCDLANEQRQRKLAQLSVLSLSRGPLGRAQVPSYERLAQDPDPMVRMAAVEQLSLIDDNAKRQDLLMRALGTDSMGVVAASARWITKHRDELTAEAAPAELASALEVATRKTWPPDAIEVKVSLIDAAAALGLLTLKPEIQKACSEGAPLVRQHAERALQALGEPKQRCEPVQERELPREVGALERRNRVLRFQTDLGLLEIHLEPKLAPVAVTRIIELARSGFYDGTAVHRVIPGFVVQMGDRGADGFGGAGTAPIPCELSPEPFAPRDVGVAISGPDSGSSQFFVTLGPYPQLGGEYTRIGRAGPGWEKLTPGDVIHKVELMP